jgi:predicted AlkP superfamily phosphohydrolase/phosphomutase
MRYRPLPFNGKEVVGWATDDRVVTPCSYPPDFYGQLLARFGEADQLGEREGSMSKKEFRDIRDRLLTLTDKLALMAKELIREEKWDLFLLCLPSLHRGGHKLWNTNNIEEPLTEAERTELEDALHQIYMASDRAVDELTRDIDPQTTVMVFSLHGMGQNSCRTWVAPEMLRLILDDLPDLRQKTPRPTTLHRVRSLVPVRWRDRVKSALPLAGRHYLTGFWRTGLVRWDQILAFSMMADVQGWIRINLKGREAHGLVSPGAEYDSLCGRIMEGLKSFVDADTGRPLVKDIFRADRVFNGEKLDWLPDIIVLWNDEPASSHRTITSARYGTFPWPAPDQNPEGRSGNHKPQGMLLVAGEGLKSGNIVDAHILDLAPTILAMLDQPITPEMEGRVLPIFET